MLSDIVQSAFEEACPTSQVNDKRKPDTLDHGTNLEKEEAAQGKELCNGKWRFSRITTYTKRYEFGGQSDQKSAKNGEKTRA